MQYDSDSNIFVSHLLGLLRGYDDNAIDGWLFRNLEKLRFLRISPERKNFWRPIIERLVLLLSDYQLLFGVAILIAGYWKHCSISVYHFSIVVDLAWFSNTHMTSLSVLKCYLQERRTLPIILASHPAWSASTPCPAQCLFEEQDESFTQTNPYVCALILHYGTSIWRVFDTTALDEFLLSQPRLCLERMRQNSKRRDPNLSKSSILAFQRTSAKTVLWQWFVSIVIRVYLGFAAILGSLTVNLYYDIVWFTLGLGGILLNRQLPTGEMIGDEHQLSFGQIVTMLMLGSLLLTFKEVYTEQKLRFEDSDLERGRIVELLAPSTSRTESFSTTAEGPREAVETRSQYIPTSLRVQNDKPP
ncbi:hypothetical protein G7Y79_00116g101810 [Physcia stellaris]|nr:hypothetical protein G7Y79_00116g101810 [Physcia stellaris]